MEQRPFHKPQFTYISVYKKYCNMHFQDRHMHLYSTFAFSGIFLTTQVWRLIVQFTKTGACEKKFA